MEKIMNLQMPGITPSGSSSRVQKSDFGDGFLKMMQQKQETPGSEPKSEKTDTPVKDTQSKPKEEPKQTPVEDQEPNGELDQLAQELAAQQAALLQTMQTPDWQEQPVQAELVVEATQELPAELVTEAFEAPKAADGEMQVPEHAKAEAAPLEDLTPQQVVPETKPEENGQEMSLPEQTAGQTAKEAPKQEAVRETVSEPVREKVSENKEEDPKAVYSQETQKPVFEKTDSIGTTEQAEGTNLKATVEELPEKLGKALGSAQTTGGQTLTVELEPVSLGKLTIRVDYEEGRAAVSILSSNPKTLELLSQKASEIASILKEHTGEETVIYTQETQQQEQDTYDGHQGQNRGDHSGQKQQKEEGRHETESFAQQLRLGLV